MIALIPKEYTTLVKGNQKSAKKIKSKLLEELTHALHMNR